VARLTGTLIDASVWIDFSRARSSRALRQFIAPYVLAAGVHLAEPIAFEVLRNATPQEMPLLTRQFEVLPMLETPTDLWQLATELGQACRGRGLNADSLDLLIASVALHHGVTLVTFDADFGRIASVSDLDVNVLKRPTA
jgi:predicted nucleic acid-binding protein